MPKTHETHGLFMTKAAPFHNGHKYCIDKALAVLDRITIVVYEADDVISVPLETRCELTGKIICVII